MESQKEKPKRKSGLGPQYKNDGAQSKLFLQFWAAYPRKCGKLAALKAWNKLDPPLSDCLKAIEAQQKTKQWRDGFIPNPATWLNQGRWMDEIEPSRRYRGVQSKQPESNEKPISLEAQAELAREFRNARAALEARAGYDATPRQ